MKRKAFITMLVFVFAIVPLLGTAQQANAKDMGHAAKEDGEQKKAKESDLGENLLKNPGFEDLKEDIPKAWGANDHWESGRMTASSEAAHTGNHGIKIESSQK